jgi:hypothetical protein
MIREYLEIIVRRNGLVLNEKKTRVLWSGPNRSWRRIIYGIGVGESDLAPSRRTRRKLRVARYKGRRPGRNRLVARGLEEWSELRPPKIEVNFTKIREMVLLEVGRKVLSE